MKADLVLSDLVEGISGRLMLILLVIVILGPSLYIFFKDWQKFTERYDENRIGATS